MAGKQMKRASLGVPLHCLRQYPLCAQFGHQDAGCIVVGEEETYFQLHDKTQAETITETWRKTND